jgi:hypothetical protein
MSHLKVDFSSCFTGYVQLENALCHREVASCEGELTLPCDAVLYGVRAFHNFALGFLYTDHLTNGEQWEVIETCVFDRK